MSLILQGPTGVFTGASMSADIERFCDLELLADTTFTTLEFQFPSGEAQEALATSVTWPVASKIKICQVKKFQVNTGTVLAHFHKQK